MNASMPAKKAQWDGVDWSMQDVEIAAIIGVSREAVRLTRRKLGKADPEFKGFLRTSWRKKAITLKRSIPDATTAQLARKLGCKVCQIAKIGEPYKSRWHFANWQLGDTDLALIWGVIPGVVAARRLKFKHGKPKWSRRLESRHIDPEYHEAIRNERRRASWFFENQPGREQVKDRYSDSLITFLLYQQLMQETWIVSMAENLWGHITKIGAIWGYKSRNFGRHDHIWHREKLTDCYVRGTLTNNSCLSAKDIPQEIIEVKRLILTAKRMIRIYANKKHG